MSPGSNFAGSGRARHGSNGSVKTDGGTSGVGAVDDVERDVEAPEVGVADVGDGHVDVVGRGRPDGSGGDEALEVGESALADPVDLDVAARRRGPARARQATVAVSPTSSSLPGSVSVDALGTGSSGDPTVRRRRTSRLPASARAVGRRTAGRAAPRQRTVQRRARPARLGRMRALCTESGRRRRWNRRGSAADESLGEPGRDAVEADPLLGHRVALAHGDRVVVEGLEVDGDAVRRTDLVLAAVAATDGAGVVELDVPVAPQLGGEVLAPSATGRRCGDSGSTATLTGASRGSSRSTVRLSTPPLVLGASSSV